MRRKERKERAVERVGDGAEEFDFGMLTESDGGSQLTATVR
jgi:hypothetical protein